MISQQQLPAYIEKNLPGLPAVDKNGNAYDIVKRLLKYTVTQVSRRNLDAARNCLTVTEQLYNKGNAAIRNAIENVYIFSFSHAFFCDENKRTEVMEIVPPSLYELYKRQVVNSHL